VRVAFITPCDIRDDHALLSGSPHYLYRALAQYTEVVSVPVPDGELPLIDQKLLGLRRRIIRRRFNPYQHPKMLRDLARRAEAAVHAAGADIVLAVGQGYAVYWDSPVPITLFSDTLYGAQIDFYDGWLRSRRDPFQLQTLSRLGQRAVNNTSKIFMTSRFAVQRSAENFGTRFPAHKTLTTLIAPCLDDPPTDFTIRSSSSPLRLLWVGVDWERKGGAQVLDVFNQLRARGIDAELHLVGQVPECAQQQPGVTHHGFIDKTQPDAHRRLLDIYQQCHVFLFPTQVDMTPIVLAEAAAAGMMIVTTRVGGIGEMFRRDEAILLEADESFVPAAAAAIEAALTTGTITQFGWNAFQRYQNRLNWNDIANNVRTELEQIVGYPQRPPSSSNQIMAGEPWNAPPLR
jgi:glycosyltransferase involved in cell wall biosynthesis